MAKTGESQTGSVSFLSSWKRSMGNLRRVAPLSLNCFGRFSTFILPYLFTVHVRPVLSPCQAGNTCYISTCFSNTCTIDNTINTICTHNVYSIMFSTAILCWGSQDFARPLIVIIHNKIDTFIILQTSLIIYLNTS